MVRATIGTVTRTQNGGQQQATLKTVKGSKRCLKWRAESITRSLLLSLQQKQLSSARSRI